MQDDNQNPITTTKLNANTINPPDNYVESGSQAHADFIAARNEVAAQRDRHMVTRIVDKHPEVAQMIAAAKERNAQRDAKKLADVRANLGMASHETHHPQHEQKPWWVKTQEAAQGHHTQAESHHQHHQTREYTNPQHHARAESPQQHHPQHEQQAHQDLPLYKRIDYKEAGRRAGLFAMGVFSNMLGGGSEAWQPQHRRKIYTRREHMPAPTNYDQAPVNHGKRDVRGIARNIGLGVLSFVSQSVGGEPMKRDHR